MTVETDADRLLMLNDWGVTATSGGASIVGIFDDKYTPIEVGGMVVESDAPIFTCRTSDAASLAHGATITINGTAYTVRTLKPDGAGMTQVVLSDG